MTPRDLLAALRSRGLTLSLAGGRLLVSPRSALTREDAELIVAHRDALAALVDPGVDALADALADRAWLDPPDFTPGGVAARESLVLRLDGFPPVAVDPAEAAALDGIARHNEAAMARWLKSGAAKAARRR